jgi:hypothetical protein
MALVNCVRLRISRSRTPTSIKAACCSAVFTGTKRIVGRLVASQSASASAASFLPRLTYGLRIGGQDGGTYGVLPQRSNGRGVGLPYCVEDDGEFARHSDARLLKADSLGRQAARLRRDWDNWPPFLQF